MCAFYEDILLTTTTRTGHFKSCKWACNNDSVYTVCLVCVCVCVLFCNYSQNIKTIPADAI